MRERFEQCILKGSIIPVVPEWESVLSELEEAERDLAAAKRSREDNDGKWAIIAAYSSMVHSYRSLILMKGYREKSDICLHQAVDALYVEEGTLDPALLAGFREAKFLHTQALYDGVYSEPGAKWIVRSAETIRDAVRVLIPGE